MNQPNPLEFTVDLALAVSDFYEYSMAHANQLEEILGIPSVFDLVLRRLPATKVIGTFTHDNIKYDQLAKRDYMVNAGLEQAAAYLLSATSTPALRTHLEQVQQITDPAFLSWVDNIKFTGDLYAMPEGTIFFGQQPQLRLHEKFEQAQIFESLLLNVINPQTNVATTANDIASITNKILLEGGSRRATSPQSSLFNSRAARIGGFTASSNIAYGMTYHEKVGGTHGHSYVMLHPTEYAAFKAQGKLFGNNVCFLLDTYNVKHALDTALQIVHEEHLTHFAFRLDSGDLLAQARWLHQEMKQQGYARNDYTLVASDDLTAGKIAYLEAQHADIDKYLVGTYVVNPPKPLGGVLKLAAFQQHNQHHKPQKQDEKQQQNNHTDWILRGKLSEDITKSTLPGIKQVYRVTGQDGYYKRDIIAFHDEDISKYLHKDDTIEPLLIPIIKDGKQVYDFPTINEISQHRKTQLAKFQDIAHYEVIISDNIIRTQQEIMREHGMN